MKCIILKNNLKEAITIAERAIGDNTNLPILKNFLIKAKDNTLRIHATNLEIGIVSNVSGKVINPGSIVVSADLLAAIISNISSERLDIEQSGALLEIRADNYEVSLPLMDTDEYPVLPTVEDKKEALKISASLMFEALTRVISAVQFSELRPEISGVHFDLMPNELILAGTDIFRLSEKKISKSLFQTNFEKSVKCIVPLRTIQEFLRISRGRDIPTTWHFNDNLMLIAGEGWEIVSRLISGTFPDYVGLGIIPKEFQTEIEVEREELINALKLSGAVSQSISEVKLVVGTNKKNLELFSAENSSGKTKSILPAKIGGEAIEIHFNWRYLLDGLKGFTDKTIVIGLNGSDKAALLKSKDVSYFYILMPAKQ
ncbi:MAG TPA: DNA polymerase III subunit beta [Candidatus Paceibacterota bacterium]